MEHVDPGAIRPFTDELHEVYVQQLQAHRLHTESDCSMALIIGSDNTMQSFINAETFLGGSGKTSTLMRHFFTSMATSELGEDTALIERDDSILTLFQFTDIFPWPGKDARDVVPLARLHRDYIETSKPLVVLPLSDRVSALAWHGLAKDFVSSYHFNGSAPVFEGKHFKEVVGEPRVCRLDGTDQYFICIPSYHPGAIARMASEGQQHFGKVMFRILSVFWLTVETIATLTKHTPPSPSLDFCSRVVAMVKERLENVGFHTGFAQDRKTLARFFAEKLKGQAKGHVARIDTIEADEYKVAITYQPYPPDVEKHPRDFYKKGGRGWIKISNRPANVAKSLEKRQVNDENSGDPLWFFAKLFARMFGTEGEPGKTHSVGLGHPDSVKSSMWLSLKDFCNNSPYVNHPCIKQIKDMSEFHGIKRNGGKHQNSTTSMQVVIRKLFPRADAYKECYYVPDLTLNNKVVKSMMLVPGRSSSFAGFIASDLDTKGVLRAGKRPMLEGEGPMQKKARKGTGIFRSGRRGRDPMGLRKRK